VRAIALAMVALALLGAVGGVVFLRPQLPAAERGRRLAEQVGCFACHGPGGLRGAANPGRLDRSVPNFEDDLMMYARTPEEVREWIADGVTRKRAQSQTWRAERERGALKMPAFRDRLSPRQIDDLVAYILVASGNPEPDDSLSVRGLARVDSLGCSSCHGPGGRLARRNPGSLKGYVPSWDGQDFPELVHDSTEFRQWVEHGVSARLERDPLARLFLRRATLRMPAFERQLQPGDVEALWAYVQWLRSIPSTDAPSAGENR
jgi:mono/diheme cytochrome c family protein